MFISIHHMLLGAALAGLVYGPAAHATLGQPLASDISQPVHIKRKQVGPVGAAAPYEARTSVAQSGLVVIEYAALHGVVFAVQWKGRTLPPLEKLLGTYFPTFRTQSDALNTARNVGSPLSISGDQLQLFSGGRMGHFAGYAFAPSLVPAGLDIHHVLQ